METNEFWKEFRLNSWEDVCKLTPEERKILEEMYETTILPEEKQSESEAL